ncbi:cytochrome P450 [Mycolicibacter terrae]|uniref:Cytochrome P450 n=1 Tax=Mycolicibacter terrae TaxID=1788 RepID=A0ACD2EM06_9MYCO|nr:MULTISPECIES: cytochrome P450 [Mycolicibacter]RRR44062.1 cytochrome P450 [Mycolicibacter terrae]
MAESRDAAWELVGRCPLAVVDDGYAVTGRALVEEVLKDPVMFSSKTAFGVLSCPVPLVPLALDPPEQTRYRRILQPLFSPRMITPHEPELRRRAAGLIEPIAERGHCDFIAEVAAVFAADAFFTVVGLPSDMRHQFVEWKDGVLGRAAPSASVTSDAEAARNGLQAAAELFDCLAGLVRQRRVRLGNSDDVLTRLLKLSGPDALTDDDVIGVCFLLVLAGVDTVKDALGFGMQRLAENADKRQELVDDPSLIAAATEELLRLDPPSPFVPRVTTATATLGTTTWPAGTMISSYLAVANRDEADFPDPQTIDFHRSTNRHTSFGLGPHRCLGAHLARLEMQIIYREWHKRIPRYHITPGATPRVRWPSGNVGLDCLPLTLEA